MSVTVKFSDKGLRAKLKQFEKPIDQKTAKSVGENVITAMKDEISSGSSPIKGRGQFPAYKNPDKYPGKRKSHTPVNLELTGAMLAALSSSTVANDSGYAAKISYKTNSARQKEQGHREGVNKQPKRPTLPSDREQFIDSIKKIYTDIIRVRLAKLLK